MNQILSQLDQFSSVTQSCLTLCDTMDYSTPGFPVPGACSNSYPSSQWCHPTISSSVIPFSPAFSLAQYQGLFQWVSSLHQVAKVFWSFSFTIRYVCICLFTLVFSFSSDNYPEVELPDCMVVLFLTFQRISILFSTVGAPTYIPINSVQGFRFFHILANTCLLSSFW